MPRTHSLSFDLSAAFPYLRPRTTVRLHPRQGAPEAPTASKMGGRIAWPRDEPWFLCPEHSDTPMVPVLQLRADDVPELAFPGHTDLFQLLWCPRDHEGTGVAPLCAGRWRSSSALGDLLEDPPQPGTGDPNYMPAPCRLHPERVVEYPSAHELTMEQLTEVTAWLDEHAGDDMAALGIEPDEPEDPANYQYHFSVAAGTKVGGYVAWVQGRAPVECDCGREMEHLVTIASAEFDGAHERWLPLDERDVWRAPYEERRKVQSAAGLMLGDMGKYYVFICRHCPDWPIWPEFQCS